MQPQHPIIATALAEQRQADLRRHADQARLDRDSRPKYRRWQWRARWGRPATRPARA